MHIVRSLGQRRQEFWGSLVWGFPAAPASPEAGCRGHAGVGARPAPCPVMGKESVTPGDQEVRGWAWTLHGRRRQ